MVRFVVVTFIADHAGTLTMIDQTLLCRLRCSRLAEDPPGLTLPQLLAGQSASSSKPKKARSVILVLLTGGPSHIDTLDMKPEAPAEIRGEFKPIRTSVSGIHICEHLPRLASSMRHWAIVRSLSHGENGHLPATHWLLTGSPMPNKRGTDLDNVLSRRDWPCYAAGLSHVQPRRDGVPSGVTLPHSLIEGPLTWPGQHAGFLGPAFDPLLVTQDPSSADFRMDVFRLPVGADRSRMEDRRRLLDRIGKVNGVKDSFDSHQPGLSSSLPRVESARRFGLSKSRKRCASVMA